MPLRSWRKQTGYSLLEFVIGLGICIFLAGVAIFVYVALSKSYYDLLSINRLEEQLRSSMNKMVLDIRRAGYSAAAISGVHTGVNSNAFMVTNSSDLSIPISSCILFTYDSDGTGLLPALGATTYDKRFGFRLYNNSLQARPLTDTAFNCTNGAWENLTDSNLIQVTALTFTPNNTTVAITGSTSTLLIRKVIISITAKLISNPTISKTVTETIRVRNDKYQP